MGLSYVKARRGHGVLIAFRGRHSCLCWEGCMSANPFDFVNEYWTDALQRWVLTLDVLRQRGNTYLERRDQIAPHVLSFNAELVLDGRTLPRPVNYVLAYIPPAEGTTLDPT